MASPLPGGSFLPTCFALGPLCAWASIRSGHRSQSSCVHRLAGVTALVAILATNGLAATAGQGQPVFTPAALAANQPIGEAKGIFPGRVVWVHSANAVNQDCVVNAAGHGWYLSENHRQPVVDGMVSSALRSLTGQTSDRAAWTALFQYHNTTRGKGAVDYVRGEKIFIKTNATSAYPGNFNPADLTPYGYVSETSIASVQAVLRQLVNVVGVEQRDIYVGDPLKHIYPHLYQAWHGEFPNVHYLDNGGYTNLGRETAMPGTTATIHYSDHGSVLRTNVWSNNYPGDNPVTEDRLYEVFAEAEYLINIPMLKGHRRAGVTMFAKNHFGSQTRSDASHLHNGLLAPTEMSDQSRDGYGFYSVLVDIMGHSLLGRKNLVFLMDALWATDYELDVPLKWQTAPFSNTYMASVFASLDPVAIESVGYDFLRSEFTTERIPPAGTYVQMNGVDDYLHQAADVSRWPAGIRYDPDGTGRPLASLGTHEHWNNATARQYSRNLSTSATGIELVAIEQTFAVGQVASQRADPGGSATFVVLVTGTPPFAYRWQRRAAGQSEWIDLHSDATYRGTSTSNLTVGPTTLAMNGDQFRCVVGDASGASTTTTAGWLTIAGSPAGRLANIATRAFCGAADQVAIAGFVVTGAPRRVLVRAVGPSLASQGLQSSELLRDPSIQLHDARHGNAVIAANDNWADNANAGEIGSTAAAIGARALAADDAASAALLLTLAPGVYSCVATGASGGTGIVLIEVYDAGSPGAGTLANLSSRTYCSTGDNVTIGGFVVSDAAKRVLVRAVGPSLSTQGLSATDVLDDPTVEVHDARANNRVIATNDNGYENANADEITAVAGSVGAAPLAADDRRSSSLLLTLPPGVYSFVVSDRAARSGVVLIEVYVAD